MRTIIIGDIHGCYDKWEELLHKSHFDSQTDRLILLGDLMDRGKDSYNVFNKAVELKKEMRERFIVLRGSHEKMLIDNSKKFKDRILWRFVGKGATLRSFRSYGASMLDSVDWFKTNTVLYYEADDYQCVHAGIRNEKPNENDEYTLLMDHGCTRQNLYNGKLTITGHIHLKKPTWFNGSGGKGRALEYNRWANLPENGIICIDTGCAEGNKLTAMIISEDQYCLICV